MQEALAFEYVHRADDHREEPPVHISIDPKSLQKPFAPPNNARRLATSPKHRATHSFEDRWEPVRTGLPRGLDLLPPWEPHSEENLEKLRQLNGHRLRLLRELRDEARAAQLETERREEQRRAASAQLYLGDNGVVGPGFSLGLAFDRYECTSPNPGRVAKPHGLFEPVPPERIANKKLLGAHCAVQRLEEPSEQLEPEPEPEPPEVSDERAVLEWLWRKAQPDRDGFLGKPALVRFLALHEEVRAAFRLDVADYQRLVDTLVTEKPGRVCFEEFEVLLDRGSEWSRNRQIAKNPSLAAQRPAKLPAPQQQPLPQQRLPLLPPAFLAELAGLFDRLRATDGPESDAVCLEDLLDALRKHPGVRQHLRSKALRKAATAEEQTLEQVLAELSQAVDRHRAKQRETGGARQRPLKVSKGGFLSFFSSHPQLEASHAVSLQLVQQRIEIVFARLADRQGLADRDALFSALLRDLLISERLNVPVAPPDAPDRFLRLSLLQNLQLAQAALPPRHSFPGFCAAFRRAQLRPEHKQPPLHRLESVDALDVSFQQDDPAPLPLFPCQKLQPTGAPEPPPVEQPKPEPELPGPRPQQAPADVPQEALDIIRNLLADPQQMIHRYIDEDRKRLSLNVAKRIASSSREQAKTDKLRQTQLRELAKLERQAKDDYLSQLEKRSHSRSSEAPRSGSRQSARAQTERREARHTESSQASQR